ncbi:MAG: response regulator [Oxalobacteraceae bacterium]|nr:MAG: response regulator [Oxalobacteraceae bacterium]
MISLEEAVVVMADPVRVEQMLWNLITNAFKFTPTGGTVTVSTSHDSGFARLDVTDTGIGLQPQYLEVVFEMFQQVQTGTARVRGGLGIGLALVKRLVELQGGRVEATSPGLNKGSTFSMWLPLARASAPSPTVSVRSNGLVGLRILVIDDEVHTLSTFGELLTMEGSAVTLVGSADEALERANDSEFDLVLSDLAMPGHDGYWLISHLRGQDRTRAWTVIALSGMGRAADREKALSAGFSAHLSKPLQLETLLQAIERLGVTT